METEAVRLIVEAVLVVLGWIFGRRSGRAAEQKDAEKNSTRGNGGS